MSIDKIIASIPTLAPEARKALRANAEARLASGDPKWAKDASSVLAAFDAYAARLANASAEKRIWSAFNDDPPTEGEHALIQTLLDHPGSTCAELSDLHGWEPNAWDMQFGKLCAKRADILGPLDSSVHADGQASIHLLTTNTRRDDGALCYTAKPEAIAAFKLLGFRVKAI